MQVTELTYLTSNTPNQPNQFCQTCIPPKQPVLISIIYLIYPHLRPSNAFLFSSTLSKYAQVCTQITAQTNSHLQSKSPNNPCAFSYVRRLSRVEISLGTAFLKRLAYTYFGTIQGENRTSPWNAEHVAQKCSPECLFAAFPRPVS